MNRYYFVLFLMLPHSAVAQTIVDQEFSAWDNVSYYLDYPGDYMAQTFTVGHSGRLKEVGIRVGLGGYSNYRPPIDDLHVRLVQTDGAGAPAIDQVLAFRSYRWQEVPDFQTDNYLKFDLSHSNVYVSAGEVLAIALSSNQTAYSGPGNTRLANHYNYDWHTSFGSPHPGGDFYLYSPKLLGSAVHKWEDRWIGPPPYSSPYRDMGFRVFVAVPEPTTLAAVTIGLTSLLTMIWPRPERRAISRCVTGNKPA